MSALRAAGAVMVIVGVGALAAPALAIGPIVGSDPDGSAKGLSYRSTEHESEGSFTSLYTTCPGKRVVLGGGGYADGAPIDGQPITLSPGALDEFGPDLPGKRTWTMQFTGVAGQLVRSHAICGGRKGTRRAKVSRTVDGGLDSLRVRCPKGSSVTGGGVQLDDSFADLVGSAPFDGGDKGKRPDDGWSARLVSSGTLVTVRAVCSRTLDLAYRTDSNTGGSPYGLSKCPGNSSLTGGGAAFIGGTEGMWTTRRINSTRPIDTADAGTVPDDSWESYGYLSGGSAKFKSYAICKK